MWRYLVGGAAALAMAGAGVLLFGGRAADVATPILPVQSSAQTAMGDNSALPDAAPEATEKTREQKRFSRYDKDRDGSITREEYLAQRRKAYAKLDVNHDGTLSFDEWAVKATTKFATADRDRSGAMTPTEFATTAVKRKSRAPVKCPPTPAEES